MSGRAFTSLARIGRDETGVSAVEFALIAPVLLMMLMGLFDFGYNMYTDALLEGSIQKAARDSTIEGADAKSGQLDEQVTEMVHAIAPGATLKFERLSYSSFGDVNQPEDYDDVNDDGVCDAGESFEDANGNGTWDADRGRTGQGAARDAVLYQVTITYPRPFPVAQLIGLDPTMTMQAHTVLRNQPYGGTEVEPTVGTCE